MESFSPQAVFDLYALLPDEGKQEFLRLVGRISTAEAPFVVTRELDLTEQGRYAEMVFKEILWRFFPFLEQEARRLAREKPQLSDEEFEKEHHERMKQYAELRDREIGELERAKLKKQRDRKSDPGNVKRNLEICNRRRQDRKKWSLGKLAKTYRLTPRAITKIISEEEKWRRLAAQPGTN